MDTEINPELFMKCRLCVEEKGKFPIKPLLKDQIKECFDIEVDPFDGHSKLLCERCKICVENFHLIRKSYQEKQALLITNNPTEQQVDDSSHIAQQQDTVTSSQQDVRIEVDDASQVNRKKSKKKKKSKKRAVSTSDSDENVENSIENSQIRSCTIKRKATKDSSDNDWRKYYSQKFVCRYCEKKVKTKSALTRHFTKHEDLRTTTSLLVDKHCVISLDKWDERPNLTGKNDVLVYNNNKILGSQDNPEFYIIYEPPENDQQEASTTFRKKKYFISDVESEDNQLGVTKIRKRIRLESSSSADTVVISNKKSENSESSDVDNSEKTALDTECINIDDSSNDGFEKSSKNTSNSKKGINFMRTIDTIVSACYSKYTKNSNEGRLSENVELDSSMLNRKLICIGRKVMSKKGIVSMGLLKYLEQKNLPISWVHKVDKFASGNSQSTNYIRIMPTLTKPENSFKGFEPCKSEVITKEAKINAQNPILSDLLQSNENVATRLENKSPKTVQSLLSCTGFTGLKPTSVASTAVTSDGNIFISDQYVKSNDNFGRAIALLNASPVANPKPATIKKKISDTSLLSGPSISVWNTGPMHYPEYPVNPVENNGTFLPIITSTHSLAAQVVPELKISNVVGSNKDQTNKGNESKENNTNTNNTLYANRNTSDVAPETSSTGGIPRIKCKPFSELMQPKVETQINSVLRTSATGIDIADVDSTKIILHTETFPNQITDSPLKYLKDLLQVHKLNLIDSLSIRPPFHTLIKFKLGLFQPMMKTLNLWIMLLGKGIDFSIKLTTEDNNNVDVHKMSATWQWEVLKAFHNIEVVKKMQNNADKIGKEFRNVVNDFCALVNTIQLKSVESVKK